MLVALQGLIDAHEAFKQTLGEADKEYNAIIGLVQEVQRISQQYGITGGADNPYTTLSAQVLLARSRSLDSPAQRFACSPTSFRGLSASSH